MRIFKKTICAAVFSVLLFTITAPAHAAETITAVQSLEKMTDEYFNNAFPDDHVAGAAVFVVKDEKILFEKGYSYADLESKYP
ncbi:hypothetical protein OBV_16820 [Oscillibacter valericigenes Sjm18-20]|nr:hypothetical protein OBV_16820 [Oscillibacter valericigenes Sjm18-20]